MTTKTCEVDGVTYEAVPPATCGSIGSLGLCTGCVAYPAGQHNSGLCGQLDDCVWDNIIWVVKV